MGALTWKEGRVVPHAMKKPPMRIFWYPLHDLSGTPTAGNTSANGLVANGQHDGVSISTVATLGVNAAGATYASTGGVTHTLSSAAYWTVTPAGADATTLNQVLDLATFVAGETLIFALELITPAGWAAAHDTTNTLLCVGNMASGQGGYAFEINSSERPQFAYWGKGATAGAAAVGTSGSNFVREGERNVLLYELICTAVNTFKMRVHVVSATDGYSVTADTAAFSAADSANGGTAAPGTAGVGFRIARRQGASSNQTQKGETIRNVWIARFASEMFSAPKRFALEMWACPNRLPPYLRGFTEDLSPDLGPDGNANKAFGEITLADMFVYLDGSTPIASHPETTVEIETTSYKFSTIATNPQYINTADFEGTTRIDTTVGGYKFGRHKTGTFKDWFIFSAMKHDQSNRGRAEVKWAGDTVAVPFGVEFWFGERFYFDFMPDENMVGQLLVHQLFAGWAGSGLFPLFTITLNTSDERLEIGWRWSDKANTVAADMNTEVRIVPAYSTPAAFRTLFQRPVNLVIKHKLHWDASQGPYTQVWIDGVLVMERFGPVGYRGPSGLTGKTVQPFPQTGIYPPSTYLTPDTRRDVYIRRYFACKNVGNYSEPLIRAALVA